MALGHGGQILVSGGTVAVAERGDWDWVDLGVQLLRDVPDPIVVFQVAAQGLTSEFPPLRTGASLVSLPGSRDRLVGRSDAVAALVHLAGEHRLVTLTGVGGTGKTRLAIEVAGTLAPDAEVTSFVDLSVLTAREQVVPAVAYALQLVSRTADVNLGAITAYLGRRASLLVFDNAEHLLEPVADVVETLLDSCAGCRIIVTSREPLGVASEAVFLVPSLDPATSAVELFNDRLGFEDDPEAVVALCVRLDGIPLAVELAAARARSLGVSEVLANLADRFRLLGGGRRANGRQATLETTLMWSHQLLSQPERVLLRRLAVFAGGFTAAAADTVCGPLDDVSVRLALAALVDKSLVVFDSATGRHRLLETVRLFAAERLVEAGEAQTAHDAHATWISEALAREPWNDYTTLAAFEPELVNILAAMEWLMASASYVDVIRLAARANGLYFGALREIEVGAIVAEAASLCNAPLSVCERVVVELSRHRDPLHPSETVAAVCQADPGTECALTAAVRGTVAASSVERDPHGALAEVAALRGLPNGLSPDARLLMAVVEGQALYRLGQFDVAEDIYVDLRHDDSSIHVYGPRLGLVGMWICAGKLDEAEELLREVSTHPYVNVRIGRIAREACISELAAARGQIGQAANALRAVESIRDGHLSMYLAADHQWFEAAGFLASTLDRIEDAAVLGLAASATVMLETSPFVTWAIAARHKTDPRWQTAIAAEPDLDDARRIARSLTRAL